jgi:hypothetical protein
MIKSCKTNSCKAISTTTMLILSAIWILISVCYISLTWNKIIELHSARSYVSPIQYGKVIFWFVSLGYWSWTVWQNIKRMSSE